MASVFNRGTRDTPRWYGVVAVGKRPDGKPIWKQRVCTDDSVKTRTQAKEWAAKVEYELLHPKPKEDAPPSLAPLCSDLMATWEKTLTNRSAKDDRSRLRRHVLPTFGARRIDEVTSDSILEWIDKQREPGSAKGRSRGRPSKLDRLAEPTIRHNLNLLSRFFRWAVARKKAAFNPVRQIPDDSRPQQSPKIDQPWINDDRMVRKLMAALPSPFDLMFYLGNRSGLRLGEIAGLRLSDLDSLDEGAIRARYSYDGCLKEDKKQEGKSKWVPAPVDAKATLADWLARRKAAGAQPEDFVFVNSEGSPFDAQAVDRAWNKATGRAERADRKKKEKKGEAKPEPLTTLSFYQATRHSFVSRNLSANASLDEVSAAVGHSSPLVTKRYYDHFVRKSFSPTLRAGLGIKPPRRKRGKVLPFAPTSSPGQDQDHRPPQPQQEATR